MTGSPDRRARDHDHYLRTDDLLEGVAGRAVRGGAFTIASQAAQFLLGLGATMVMARLLTPRDYGLVGMVTVVTGFLRVFKDVGLGRATIQRPTLTHGQASNLFWVNAVVGLAVMLVTIALAPLLARFYGRPELTAITMVLSIGFFTGGLSVQHQALLRRRMRFGLLAITDIASLILAIIVGIVMAWRGFAYWAIVGNQLTLVTAGTVAAWIACRWRPALPSRREPVRDLLLFGGNVTGFTVSNYFARNSDDLLIGRVWGSVELGLYTKAYRLLLFPLSQINLPVSAVAVPALSRMVDEPERYRAAFLRILEKVAMVAMPLVAYFMVTSDWVMEVMLGPRWIGAAPMFMWLAVAGLVQPVTGTTGWLFTSQDRTGPMLRWGLVSSVITVASIVGGLPWGGVGVACSYGVVNLVVNTPLSLWAVGRAGPVRTRDFYITCWPFAAAATGAGLAVLAYRRLAPPASALTGLIVSFVIAAAAALAVMAAFRGGRKALRDLIESSGHLMPDSGRAREGAAS